MPSTIATKEELPEDITDEEVADLINLRLKAGAIRSWKENGFLHTEWNVIGE
uniref:Uncharacterized protein n=1 Tax=Candidatus Kentrum sp. LFY TaxID=2126342 RepID=A0A450UG95_9GAMM|nr:MAG: hypothetical protein BECKLFY1418B_GA0070995_102615 [Candidatus Kentron sp. LFY]